MRDEIVGNARKIRESVIEIGVWCYCGSAPSDIKAAFEPELEKFSDLFSKARTSNEAIPTSMLAHFTAVFAGLMIQHYKKISTGIPYDDLKKIKKHADHILNTTSENAALVSMAASGLTTVSSQQKETQPQKRSQGAPYDGHPFLPGT